MKKFSPARAFGSWTAAFSLTLGALSLTQQTWAATLTFDASPTAGIQAGTGPWDTNTTTDWNSLVTTTSNQTWVQDDVAAFSGGASTLTIATGTTIDVTGLNQASSSTYNIVINGTDSTSILQIDGTSGALLTNNFGSSTTTINTPLVLNAATPSGIAVNFTTNLTVNGNISDGTNHPVVRINSSTTLNGNNTNSGGMQVQAGLTLALGQGTSAGSGIVSLVANTAAAPTILATAFTSDANVANALQLSGPTASTASYATFSSTGSAAAKYTNTSAFTFGPFNGLGSPQAQDIFNLAFAGTSGTSADPNSFATRIVDSAPTVNATFITSVNKTGTGVWSLTNGNSYSGPTTISAGTLLVGANDTPASTVMTTTAASFSHFATTITLSSTAGIVVGDVIAGTSFTPGTTITAVNTTNNTVTLSTGGAGAAGSTGQAIDVFGTGALGNAASTITLGDATTTTNHSSPTLLIGGAYTEAHAITVSNNATTGAYALGGSTNDNSVFSNTVVLNNNVNLQSAATGGNAVTYSGVISGTGAVNTTGTGKTSLTNSNSYSGGTTVTSGILAANNTANATAGNSATGTGAVTVSGASGAVYGTLAGGSGAANSGILTATSGGASLQTYASNAVNVAGAVTINANGHLAPGNSVGTLTLNTLTLASGSVLDYEVNGTANDFTVVGTNGGLTVNGGAVNLYQEGTTTAFSTAGVYNLLSYSGTLGGSVNNLSVANAVNGVNYSFVNDTVDDLVQLDITVTSVPEPGTWFGGAVMLAACGAYTLRRRFAAV